VIFQAQREVLDGYQALVDEDVVEYAREGDDAALEYLINKYKNFVRAKARSYFLIGADREDIIQEGMIGLYKAIRDFRLDKLSSFRAFASLTGYYNHFAKTRLKQTGWTNYRQTKHRFDQLKTKLNTEQTRYQPTKLCHKNNIMQNPAGQYFNFLYSAANSF
jgi:DNA-directed RNA polymerase specialized sigma subunit